MFDLDNRVVKELSKRFDIIEAEVSKNKKHFEDTLIGRSLTVKYAIKDFISLFKKQ